MEPKRAESRPVTKPSGGQNPGETHDKPIQSRPITATPRERQSLETERQRGQAREVTSTPLDRRPQVETKRKLSKLRPVAAVPVVQAAVETEPAHPRRTWAEELGFSDGKKKSRFADLDLSKLGIAPLKAEVGPTRLPKQAQRTPPAKPAVPPKPMDKPEPVKPVKIEVQAPVRVVNSPGSVPVMLVFPNGRRVKQQFRTSGSGKKIYDFVAVDGELANGPKHRKFYLSNGSARLVCNQTLEAQGVVRPSLMTVFLAWEGDRDAY
jgi:hypothetical protein